MNGKNVDRISPILDEGAEWGRALVFPENKEINFQGSVLAGEGFTNIYNRFHKPEESDTRIAELRDLHRRMDETTCEAYGWDDLKLDHDFHRVDYLSKNDRLRFTIGEKARLEILHRLSLLNRRRY